MLQYYSEYPKYCIIEVDQLGRDWVLLEKTAYVGS